MPTVNAPSRPIRRRGVRGERRVGGEVGHRSRNGIEGEPEPERHARDRRLEVVRRERSAARDHGGDAGAGPHEALDRGLRLDDDAGAARGEHRREAHELHRVAEALLGAEEDCPPVDRGAVPAGRRRRRDRVAGHAQPPLVLRPAAREIAVQQAELRAVRVCLRKLRGERDRAVEVRRGAREVPARLEREPGPVVRERVVGADGEGRGRTRRAPRRAFRPPRARARGWCSLPASRAAGAGRARSSRSRRRSAAARAARCRGCSARWRDSGRPRALARRRRRRARARPSRRARRRSSRGSRRRSVRAAARLRTPPPPRATVRAAAALARGTTTCAHRPAQRVPPRGGSPPRRRAGRPARARPRARAVSPGGRPPEHLDHLARRIDAHPVAGADRFRRGRVPALGDRDARRTPRPAPSPGWSRRTRTPSARSPCA